MKQRDPAAEFGGLVVLRHKERDREVLKIDPIQLRSVEGAALFYPCCGQDLEVPIRLFSSVVATFYFVDVRRPRRPGIGDADLLQVHQDRPADRDKFRDRVSRNEFDVYRLEQRGEDAFMKIQRLGVFFHRGDTLANGEGSSGVPWLGKEWLSKIIGNLVPGGFVVTDGSNRPPDGPPELSAFHGNRTVGARAVDEAKAFEFGGRVFSCVGYAGNRRGPTLVWQAS